MLASPNGGPRFRGMTWWVWDSSLLSPVRSQVPSHGVIPAEAGTTVLLPAELGTEVPADMVGGGKVTCRSQGYPHPASP
jgi:hypothetical protein